MLSRSLKNVTATFFKGVVYGVGINAGKTVWDENLKYRFFPLAKNGAAQLLAPKIKSAAP